MILVMHVKSELTDMCTFPCIAFVSTEDHFTLGFLCRDTPLSCCIFKFLNSNQTDVLATWGQRRKMSETQH